MIKTAVLQVATIAILAAAALVALWFVATQPFVGTTAWHGRRADPPSLRHHVNQLAHVLPGRGHDADALDASADYIYAEFRKYGQPTFQLFGASGSTYKNVALRFGSGAAYKITIGAHYDTYAGLPGADDNASGVAGLLELARLLAGEAPPADIELVAYALEEPPSFGTRNMGSFHHAETTDADLTLVLEMIGYFQDQPGSQTYPAPLMKYLYSDTGDFIALVGRLDEISPVRTIKAAFKGAVDIDIHSLTFFPIIPGVTLSDHRNYWARGRKAIMVTDTAYQRNPYYHTPEDTPDKLDYEKMSAVVTGVYAALFALAGNR